MPLGENLTTHSDIKIEVARQVSQTVPEDYTNELQVLYFPQLGKDACVVRWYLSKYWIVVIQGILSGYHRNQNGQPTTSLKESPVGPFR